MNRNKPYYLFVYGTLRSYFDTPVKKELSGYIEWIGKAKVKGKLFDIGAYRGALPAQGEQCFIKGEVMKVKAKKEVLKILDQYEGYNSKAIIKSEYYRKEEEILLSNRQKITAGVYWYNQPIQGKRRIKHNDYLDYLRSKKIAS